MKPQLKTILIQVSLFIATIITTTLAGAEWQYGHLIPDSSPEWPTWNKISRGFLFSLPFLGILTVHEFGHYIVAKKHKVNVSLPYYIPMWLGFLGMFSLGTMGAFIRIKSLKQTNKQYFDIGIAGPLAGFIAALIVLYYGFTHLPDKDYIFTIFPEFIQYGHDYVNKLPANWQVLYLGDNLLFKLFENYVANPDLVPPSYELMHHPILFAGYMSLFFTSMNLLPIGQLDGGHILYGLVGPEKHFIVSRFTFLLLLFYSGIGILNPYVTFEEMLITLPLYILFLYTALFKTFEDVKTKISAAVVIASLQFLLVYFFPLVEGSTSWIFFALVVGRFLGVKHPDSEIVKITSSRKILGWISLLIFILCFSPKPFYIH